LNPIKDPLRVEGTALAVFEIASIARGIYVLDQMAKHAETAIVASRTVTPGKYFIIISGHVANVEEAQIAARSTMGEDRIDDLIIRDPHPDLRKTLCSDLNRKFEESLAIVELTSLCSTVLALDRVLKETNVNLIELRLGAGLSGKGVFTLSGALHMIEAACDAIEQVVDANRIVGIEKISQIHEDLPQHLLGAEWPKVRGPRSD
jgi:microcompartment protein CcmL/EutN